MSSGLTGIRRREAGLDLPIAYTVIELDNLWAGTAQSLFVSTAFEARDGSGQVVEWTKETPPKSVDEALKKSGVRFDKWWMHRMLLRALRKVGASNESQVQAALNASPDVFEHLHTFRNFYAHRGSGTREKVQESLHQLRYSPRLTATEALSLPRPGRGRPQPLMLDWLDEMRIAIELLV